jgi:hypothetical protein
MREVPRFSQELVYSGRAWAPPQWGATDYAELILMIEFFPVFSGF